MQKELIVVVLVVMIRIPSDNWILLTLRSSVEKELIVVVLVVTIRIPSDNWILLTLNLNGIRSYKEISFFCYESDGILLSS